MLAVTMLLYVSTITGYSPEHWDASTSVLSRSADDDIYKAACRCSFKVTPSNNCCVAAHTARTACTACNVFPLGRQGHYPLNSVSDWFSLDVLTNHIPRASI